MKKLDVSQLTKKELVFLASHRCSHGHSFLSHYTCYLREVHSFKKERVGILDIETNGFDADYNCMLSYAIKNADTGEVLGRVLTTTEIHDGTYDRILCGELIRDLAKFDRIVGYYIKDRRFDLPFIRSRCLFHRLDFPKYGTMKFTDLYDIVKNKMKLKRSGLKQACGFLGIPAKQHNLDSCWWLDIMTGKQAALDHVWTHNVEDVDSTLTLWNRIKDYQRRQTASI